MLDFFNVQLFPTKDTLSHTYAVCFSDLFNLQLCPTKYTLSHTYVVCLSDCSPQNTRSLITMLFGSQTVPPKIHALS